MLTLLTEYPNAERALVLAVIKGYCAWDDETQRGLSPSRGRRRAGSVTRRYFLTGYGRPITATSDTEAVEKARLIISSTAAGE